MNQITTQLCSRRAFLQSLALATTAILFTPGCSFINPRVKLIDNLKEHNWLGEFFYHNQAELDNLAKIGKNYLDDHPKENNLDLLIRLLFLDQSKKLKSEVISGSDINVKKHIASSHIADCDNDRITVVDGWHLTRTECRLYALAKVVTETKV